MGQYTLKQIATELLETALRTTYHGNALYVALWVPGLNHDDRAVLDRWLRGAERPADHDALQSIALKITDESVDQGNSSALRGYDRLCRALHGRPAADIDSLAGHREQMLQDAALVIEAASNVRRHFIEMEAATDVVHPDCIQRLLGISSTTWK